MPEDDISNRLADWVRETASIRGIRHSALAEALGVNPSTVSRWFLHHRRMSLADLCNVARYFDLGADHILAEISGLGDLVISRSDNQSGGEKREATDLIYDLQQGHRISRTEAAILRRAIGRDA